MRSILLLVLALAAPAFAFRVNCDGYYPDAEAPQNTTILAEVLRDASGKVVGLRCSAIPRDACPIADGACCPCKTHDNGCVPECSASADVTDAETTASCLQEFPPDYCESASGAFVTESPRAVTKHSKKPKKPKKQRRR